MKKALILGTILAPVAWYSYLLATPSITVPIESYSISNEFRTALLAEEDPTFDSHSGVDFGRLMAVYKEARQTGNYRRGGSTITMQLAKIGYVGYSRTLFRKLNQIVIALLLEVIYSKDEILFTYLENISFAPGIVGLKSAARWKGTTPENLGSEASQDLVLRIFDPTKEPSAFRRKILSDRLKRLRS